MVQMDNKWENNNPIKTPETAKDLTLTADKTAKI